MHLGGRANELRLERRVVLGGVLANLGRAWGAERRGRSAQALELAAAIASAAATVAATAHLDDCRGGFTSVARTDGVREQHQVACDRTRALRARDAAEGRRHLPSGVATQRGNQLSVAEDVLQEEV